MPETSGLLAPCPYPGCRDANGKPQLTRRTICDSSRRHYRRILDRLVLAYLEVRATLPRNQATASEGVAVKSPSKEYGHPAEWASDFARLIADQLNEAHDDLADHLTHTPAPHPANRELGKVCAAHRYLTNWFSELCVYPGAIDTAISLCDLDSTVRRGLGTAERRSRLHVPCPSCELLTLTRRIDSTTVDEVSCSNCHYRIPMTQYHVWVRFLMDEILESSA